jgi:cohesin loading factor subunit SCC2
MADRLRDGRSIRTVSALLLQLVQTSAHDVRLEASRITKERQQLVNLRRQESFSDQDSTSEPFLDELDDRVSFLLFFVAVCVDREQDIRLYSTGLESATKAAKTIVLFLTQRLVT